MSVCDSCNSPGHCCREIPLNIRADHPLDALAQVARYWPASNLLPLPFYNPRLGGDGQTWVFHCAALDERTGRCNEYEHRPDTPCRVYNPGNDPLCAQFVPGIGLCTCVTAPVASLFRIGLGHVSYPDEVYDWERARLVQENDTTMSPEMLRLTRQNRQHAAVTVRAVRADRAKQKKDSA